MTIQTYEPVSASMIDVTFTECPQKVVCVQGGAFEFMLALGLADYITVAYIPDGYEYMSADLEKEAKKVDVRDRKTISKEDMVMLQPDLIVGWPSVFQSSNSFCTGTMEEWESRGTKCYAYGSPAKTIQDYYDHLSKMAKVFGKEENAKKIQDQMESSIAGIKTKTASIPESEKPSVLTVVLSAGYVLRAYGDQSLVGEFIADAGGKAAWHGNLEVMSMETIAGIKPDVIVYLISGTGWTDEKLIAEYEEWLYGQEGLASVPAIQNHRVCTYGLNEVSMTSVPQVDIFDRLYADIYQTA